MSTTYLPTVVALAGSAIGGLISFATAWLTQRQHDRAKRLSGERPDDSICTSNSATRSRRSTPTRWSTIRRRSRRWSASTRSSAEAAMRPIVERIYRDPDIALAALGLAAAAPHGDPRELGATVAESPERFGEDELITASVGCVTTASTCRA